MRKNAVGKTGRKSGVVEKLKVMSIVMGQPVCGGERREKKRRKKVLHDGESWHVMGKMEEKVVCGRGETWRSGCMAREATDEATSITQHFPFTLS